MSEAVTENERTASCSCDQLRATCRGEPARISLCHCFACKKRTGSDFTLNATYADEQVTIVGEARVYERYGEDGGNWVRQSFCPHCGTTLFHRIELRPGMVSVAIGCFGTHEFPPPRFEVYRECAMQGLELHIEPAPEQQ